MAFSGAALSRMPVPNDTCTDRYARRSSDSTSAARRMRVSAALAMNFRMVFSRPIKYVSKRNAVWQPGVGKSTKLSRLQGCFRRIAQKLLYFRAGCGITFLQHGQAGTEADTLPIRFYLQKSA